MHELYSGVFQSWEQQHQIPQVRTGSRTWSHDESPVYATAVNRRKMRNEGSLQIGRVYEDFDPLLLAQPPKIGSSKNPAITMV
jgi:hypothetical protein